MSVRSASGERTVGSDRNVEMTLGVPTQLKFACAAVVTGSANATLVRIDHLGVECVAQAVDGRYELNEVVDGASDPVVFAVHHDDAQIEVVLHHGLVPIESVLQKIAKDQRFLRDERFQVVGIGQISCKDVVEQWRVEKIATSRRVVTDRHGRKGLRSFDDDRDGRLRWVLEKLGDGLVNEEDHHARESDEGDGPEDAVVPALTTSDARQGMCRRVEGELADDGRCAMFFSVAHDVGSS